MTDRDGYLTSSEVWQKQMIELRDRPLIVEHYKGYYYINGSAAGYGKTLTRHRKRVGDGDKK